MPYKNYKCKIIKFLNILSFLSIISLKEHNYDCWKETGYALKDLNKNDEALKWLNLK